MKKYILLFLLICLNLTVMPAMCENPVKLSDEVIRARGQIGHERILKLGLAKWVTENNIDNAEECLQAGQNPNIYRGYDKPALLEIAVKNDNAQMVTLLLNYGASYASIRNDILTYAICNNKHKSALVMINHERFPHGYLTNDILAQNAIKYDMPDILEILLKKGWSPNYSDNLILAIKNNKYKTAEMMLQYGANPDRISPKKGLLYPAETNPLFYAVKKDDSKAIQLLIKYNVNLNAAINNQSAVNYALKNKQYEIAEFIINAGAKPNFKSLELINKTKGNESLKLLIRQKISTSP